MISNSDIRGVPRTTSLSEWQFLVIGGTSKGGTTSVFNYLANHPAISASCEKETRFFLDSDYPLASAKRYETDGPTAYLSFFEKNAGADKLRLEATPDYLYSSGAPSRLRQTLKNVRIIFLLRDPCSRLLSFYRFAQRMNDISKTMSFDRYVQLQRENEEAAFPIKYPHPAFYALQHGRYSNYLAPFFELFGRSAIHVAFYEHLRNDPHAFVTSLCHWIGIDDSFFRNYSFEVTNRGSGMRSPRLNRAYYLAKRTARACVRHQHVLRAMLRGVGKNVNRIYNKVNATPLEEASMTSQTKDYISAFYSEEPARLERMLAVKPPWQSGK